jgi:hypothetical protein
VLKAAQSSGEYLWFPSALAPFRNELATHWPSFRDPATYMGIGSYTTNSLYLGCVMLSPFGVSLSLRNATLFCVML